MLAEIFSPQIGAVFLKEHDMERIQRRALGTSMWASANVLPHQVVPTCEGDHDLQFPLRDVAIPVWRNRVASHPLGVGNFCTMSNDH